MNIELSINLNFRDDLYTSLSFLSMLNLATKTLVELFSPKKLIVYSTVKMEKKYDHLPKRSTPKVLAKKIINK